MRIQYNCGYAATRQTSTARAAAFHARSAPPPSLPGLPWPPNARSSRCRPGSRSRCRSATNFNDEDLAFAKQMGVEYVTVGTSGGTYETFAEFKKRSKPPA